jgi:hypothetical protein
MHILVYIKKLMSMKPNPKEINIILNILKGAQFEFLPRAPFYIDTPLLPNNFQFTRESQVTNGSQTAVMDVTGFLCVSLGSSTVQLHDSLSSRRACVCSEDGFSNQNGDRA